MGVASLVLPTMTTGKKPIDARLRTAVERFATEKAVPEYREVLERLYAHWHFCNGEFFGGRLHVPTIVLGSPGPRALGTCAPVSGSGGGVQITVWSAIPFGREDRFRPGARYREGRLRIADDVLLHEMIHQAQFEADVPHGTNSHDAPFRDECNRIGEMLGLGPVRAARNRGLDAELPSCSGWPHCVRPRSYYRGAYVEPTRPNEPDTLDRMRQQLAAFLQAEPERRDQLLEMVREMIAELAPKSPETLAPGRKVRHRHYGVGVVRRVVSRGKPKVVVAFDVGERALTIEESGLEFVDES